MNPLSDLFATTAARCGSRDLWRIRTFGGRWRSHPFREVAEDVARRAARLVGRGLVPGARVLVLVPPGPELFAVLLALFQAGGVPVLADPRVGLRAFARCVADARPTVVVAPPAVLLVLRAWGLARSTLQHYWSSSLTRGPEGTLAAPHRSLDDEAAVVFTSGSTGTPQGVILTQANLLAQCRQVREGWDPKGVDLPTLPLFALLDAFTGTTAVLPPGGFRLPSALSPRRLASALQKHEVTILFLSPVVLRNLGLWCQRRGLRLDSLRQVFTAGAPAPASDQERFRSLMRPDAALTAVYGATECLLIATHPYSEALETAGGTRLGAGVCLGRPLAGVEVRIEGAPGLGEIVVSGEGVSPGSIEAIRGDPWHPTGDLGYFDDRGRLWLVGRKSQVVVTPEGPLYPEQVEGRFNGLGPLGRTALGASPGAVLWVETREWGWGRPRRPLEAAVRRATPPWTGTIRFRRRFPTDARHSSKILRDRLRP